MKMDNTSFSRAEMYLQVGDVITSKKGVQMGSRLTNFFYLVKKMEYLGNGCFRALEKERMVAGE